MHYCLTIVHQLNSSFETECPAENASLRHRSRVWRKFFFSACFLFVVIISFADPCKRPAIMGHSEEEAAWLPAMITFLQYAFAFALGQVKDFFARLFGFGPKTPKVRFQTPIRVRVFVFAPLGELSIESACLVIASHLCLSSASFLAFCLTSRTMRV